MGSDWIARTSEWIGRSFRVAVQIVPSMSGNRSIASLLSRPGENLNESGPKISRFRKARASRCSEAGTGTYGSRPLGSPMWSRLCRIPPMYLGTLRG